jgi:ABC-type protease/lipase transport system fused ATPase/permease subunit
MKVTPAGASITAGTVATAVLMPWTDIFKNILGSGGVHPALFLLVVGGLAMAVIVLARAFQRSEVARDTERSFEANNILSIQEKRIEEGKAMLLALERTSTALAAHTAALESRTVAVNEMVQALARMNHAQESSREHFKGVAERLEENQKIALGLLRGR